MDSEDDSDEEQQVQKPKRKWNSNVDEVMGDW
jgi:hypothetical protein